ncbi:hypothetical protein FACS18949_05390 [Clostridia bacterium]|nr:hypothetical protein FACS18949_05390 [Clostridia bacterium]
MLNEIISLISSVSLWVLIVMLAIVFCAPILPANIARRKGRSWGLFYLFGVFLFPPALIVALFIKKNAHPRRRKRNSDFDPEIWAAVFYILSLVAFIVINLIPASHYEEAFKHGVLIWALLSVVNWRAWLVAIVLGFIASPLDFIKGIFSGDADSSNGEEGYDSERYTAGDFAADLLTYQAAKELDKKAQEQAEANARLRQEQIKKHGYSRDDYFT